MLGIVIRSLLFHLNTIKITWQMKNWGLESFKFSQSHIDGKWIHWGNDIQGCSFCELVKKLWVKLPNLIEPPHLPLYFPKHKPILIKRLRSNAASRELWVCQMTNDTGKSLLPTKPKQDYGRWPSIFLTPGFYQKITPNQDFVLSVEFAEEKLIFLLLQK